MSQLEKTLIASIFSEETYSKVSFLEAKDFTDKTYQFFWDLISRYDGDVIKAMGNLELTDKKELSKQVFTYSTLLGSNNIERVALNMIELRFKRLLNALLTDLSRKTKNRLEADLLNECVLAIPDNDIFELSEGVLEYLGHQSSDHTKERLNSYLKYVDERCETVKKVINGTK